MRSCDIQQYLPYLVDVFSSILDLYAEITFDLNVSISLGITFLVALLPISLFRYCPFEYFRNLGHLVLD